MKREFDMIFMEMIVRLKGQEWDEDLGSTVHLLPGDQELLEDPW